MKNVVILSHNDLDGVAGPEVAEALFREMRGSEEVSHFEKNYIQNGEPVENAVKNLTRRIKTINDVMTVFILDISASYELMESLYQACAVAEVEVIHCDHHISAVALNQLSEGSVRVLHECGMKASATSLVFERFVGLSPEEYLYQEEISQVPYMKNIATFCEIVRSYDTWDWVNQPNNLYKGHANKVNNLLYLIGMERFFISLEDKKFDFSSFSKFENQLLEIDAEREFDYVETKRKQAIIREVMMNGKAHVVAFVLVEQYHSMVGNELAKMSDEKGVPVDFVVMFNSDKVSIRTNKPEIKANEIASAYFNGNGHSASAGGSENVLNYLFARMKEKLEG